MFAVPAWQVGPDTGGIQKIAFPTPRISLVAFGPIIWERQIKKRLKNGQVGNIIYGKNILNCTSRNQ